MKINFIRIVVDHVRTLKRADDGKISITDIVVFYAIPIMFAAFCFFYTQELKAEFYNVSITFFGIFVALMLNIQVALFGIFARNREAPSNERSVKIFTSKHRDRKVFMGEVNANISYLILVSCISLAIFLVLFAISLVNMYVTALCVGIYTHFILTLMMVIKRSHVVFQREYLD